MSYDGLLEVLLPSAAPTTSGLVFGTIDAAGKVFLEPGSVPIVPPPPSLTPLTPSSRFVGMMQGSAGKPQSLLISGSSAATATLLGRSSSSQGSPRRKATCSARGRP